MTGTPTPAATVSEADAIGALLERLPHASPEEVLELGRDCPHRHVANQADRLHIRLGAVSGQQAAQRWMTDLERLRTRLTGLVSAAYKQAAAAEAWLRDLEQEAADDPEPAQQREVAEPSSEPAPARPRGRRDATGPASTNKPVRPPARRRGRGTDAARQCLIGSTQQPGLDELALVRRLCHRMATSPIEADELIAMLGVEA